jgi:nicotinate-nucleotide adenylyltransferase
LWFVVSPHNPLKAKTNLLDDYQRLELVVRAIGDDSRFRASSIEFKLPKPSYTVDTLAYLSEEYPHYEFYILMGSDNLETIHKWKNYEFLLANYKILVYPRPESDPAKYLDLSPNIIVTEAPVMDISSTFIRMRSAQAKMSVIYACQGSRLSDEMNFYKK